MIKLLTFSTLFPSSAQPSHGIFVETRLRELLGSGQVQAKVIAPVPWFISSHPRFGERAKFAATPRQETRNGIAVEHPRYLLLPKIGMNRAPAAIARAALPVARQLQAQGFDFDLIDAHYYYPDGVAAAAVAKALGKPLVVTARGTDLSLIPDYPKPRQMILDTAAQAAASIGVCRALMDKLASLGADPAKLHVLRNGVDLQRFRPEDPAAARARLGLPAHTPLWLAVGHLIERKGQAIAIEALAAVPQAQLLLVGRGPDEAGLRARAQQLGVLDRVRFIGAVPNEELRWWYSAASVSLLCSSREGWANVLLESMACGTPVLATDIWGTPEVLARPEAGRLLARRDAAALVDAWQQLQAAWPERAATRRYAEGFSWQATTEGQLALFNKVLGR